MENTKRALCFNEAKENGLVFNEYEFKGVPTEFTAVLRYKIWGKSMNLKFFVEDEEDCGRYSFSIFRNRDNNFYAPRKMPDLDLSDKQFQPGMRFLFKTKITRGGNTDLLEAKLL